MSRRSGHLQKISENPPGQMGKVTKNQTVLEGVAKPYVLIKTSGKGVGGDCDAVLASTNSLVQPSPLPHLGSPEGVWVKMVCREQNYRCSKSFLLKHPTIQPRMRSILLDWLMEVSEAYSLHRQTFYLAQDYFDRFMLTQNNIEKGMLQLIGITCLFIASKMEEPCPPKLSQMAYVTAGTYYEDEILQMELIILKALKWNLCPETAVSWLKLYFQMASMTTDSDLLESQFPQEAYIQMTRLLDLCILNINSLDFEYRVLAASVLGHFIQQETAEKISGLLKDSIQLCGNWMAPSVEWAGWCGRAALRNFAKIKREDRHNIQTHMDYMAILEDVRGEQPVPHSSQQHRENLHTRTEAQEEEEVNKEDTG
ncbi:G1/S-specific cyclin-E2-like isoform X2 [Cottoperca gobio]|uniref:G2/mitotic-specific cyclin-B2 n=1 Tax=Cottoperca gobio TaxID=56716 RepID=A0A6J2QQC9_COTGO|nr:G1/S-specific cyclin-E2-like isoform X2 [Cottoperca gobio]XP_029299541.1 G1/S-specific cyclin-E2-like isoform X2 [Cottoperca gobio]